jgi:hypothetical protein
LLPVGKKRNKTKKGLRPKNSGKQKQNRGREAVLPNRQIAWTCSLKTRTTATTYDKLLLTFTALPKFLWGATVLLF